MKVHVLTLTWNGLDKLKRLAPSLMGQFKTLKTNGFEPKWHVNDNGSKDSSVEFLKTIDNTNVYEVGHNRNSFSKGVNDLAEKADSGIVVLLNNDVVFKDSDSLSKMINLLSDDVGIVGARLMSPNSDVMQHAGVIFSKRYNSLPFHYKPNQKVTDNDRKNRYFQAVTAACCVVKYDDFLKVDGLDEKYKWSFEDVDFCLKMKSINKKVLYCGDVEIYHETSATLKKNPVNKLFMSSNVSHFKNKWQNKYELDLEKYEADPNYNLYE